MLDTADLNTALIYKRHRLKCVLPLLIPLLLSAFTHLWNPIGFPSIYHDESVYIERAVRLLEGVGLQDPTSPYERYDHPYFGWIFLAGLLKLVGYPDSLNPIPGDVQSVEMLYMIPRLMMGLLAVVDTFLVYKIADYRYNNKNIAFIASLLFAVMPSTWLLRRILLDSILLPFLLASILFAVYYNKRNKESYQNRKGSGDSITIVLLSGIFLGLAIFTKIPAFTMIPLVAYLIFTSTTTNNRKRIRTLGIWFVPVILIPLLWPAYAASVGELDKWFDPEWGYCGRQLGRADP